MANAIWLCQNCARMIDVDPGQYTLATLLAWKAQHETFAADTIAGRFAALDRRHIEQLATITRQAATMLEELVPMADAPAQEVSLRAFARLRFEHPVSRYSLAVTIVATNLGNRQVLLADPQVRIGVAAVPVSEVHLFQDGLWHLNPGIHAFVIPAMGEIKIRIIIDADTFIGDGDCDHFWLTRTDVTLGERREFVEAIAQTNRALCELAVGKKLRPLQQWICDRCSLPILRPEDGWVEIDQARSGVGVTYQNFRLVHHARATPRRAPQHCYADGLELTEHLHHVLAQGVQWALGFLGPGETARVGASLRETCEVGEWAIFVRRLWLPFYEQGRQYIVRALAEGDLDPEHVYDQDALELAIERYGPKEWTPDLPLD